MFAKLAAGALLTGLMAIAVSSCDADRLNNERRLEPEPAAARKLATGFLFWLQQGMALLGM